jgi:hypothetical protein
MMIFARSGVLWIIFIFSRWAGIWEKSLQHWGISSCKKQLGYRDLFADAERNMCRERLERFGYRSEKS